jgi:thioredoxin-dependent peroxiredoxin
MLNEGQAAPQFELLDDQSRTVKLSDLRGQTFVLYFFPRADTPG